MSRAESLSLELDTLKMELERLKAENARLKVGQPPDANDEEPNQLKELYEQAVSDLSAKDQEIDGLRQDLEDVTQDYRLTKEELAKVKDAAELELHRALSRERQKWENREMRLVEQLKHQERTTSAVIAPHSVLQGSEHLELASASSVPIVTGSTIPTLVSASSVPSAVLGSSIPSPVSASLSSSVVPGLNMPSVVTGSTMADAVSRPSLLCPTSDLPSQDNDGQSIISVSGPDQLQTQVNRAIGAAMLAHQIPPIPKFSGDPKSEMEDFKEWFEQFELVASACQWDDQARLVNLSMRLKGPAYSFYRSCTPSQRASYPQLVDALKKRFTPVKIQSVQTSLFHDRRQGTSETVDGFAQDLKTLFYKAYPSTLQGGREAEEMGRTVLSAQFVAGLRKEIKLKLAGQEGTIEQLLVRARFEEAKLNELASPSPKATSETAKRTGYHRQTNKGRDQQQEQASGQRDRERDSNQRNRGRNPCYSCGDVGHYARQCPLRRNISRESQSKGSKNVARITPVHSQPSVEPSGDSSSDIGETHSTTELSHDQDTSPVDQANPTPGDAQTDCHDKAIDEVLDEVLVLYGVTSPQLKHGALGPTPTAIVDVEGTKAEALVDTGSPVSIISLEFLVKALAKTLTGQNKETMKGIIRERLSPTLLRLKSYGGETIPIVRQAEVKLSRGPYSVTACVQVQKEAPVQILLGTDVQALLGLRLVDDAIMESPPVPQTSEGVTGKPPGESTEQQPARVTGMQTEQLPSTEQHARVCLLHSVKVPAQRIKIVTVGIEGTECEADTTLAFQPEPRIHELTGLFLEEALIENKEVTTMAIVNPGHHPIDLKQGQVLGCADQVKLLEATGGYVDSQDGEVCINRIKTGGPQPSKPQRHSQLLQLLRQEEWNITRGEREGLEALIAHYGDVFALDQTELGCAQDVTHVIDTADHEPVKQHPRRVPFALRRKVEEMVNQMLKDEIITPSKSPWASPIVLVSKKDGSTRFCVDYRKLNALTKKDVYPLPRIDDTLDLLASNKVFSTLDLASGYWQIAMDKSSQEKTAFATHVGLYEFRVMPFGLCNAPATFQRLMETLLAGLIGKICLVYLDDVLVLGKTTQEHLQNLEAVWHRLHQAGLRLKPSKCSLFRDEVEYLGFRVSPHGVATDTKKVKAIRDYSIPTDVRALRSFLGLMSYYRRFVPGFSVVANPLFALTRKDAPFDWGPDCQDAFQTLKDILSSASVLAFPDFTKEFILETDASIQGLGAVLSQAQTEGGTRPIAFASRTLQAHEKNYGITELEGLAVIWAVKHFRQYLYGHRCQVYTDHEALKALLNTPHPSGKLARWGLVIQEMDLTINYRPGKKNEKADALSRYPVNGENSEPIPPVLAVVTAHPPGEAPSQAGDTVPQMSLKDRQHLDPDLHKVMCFMEDGDLPEDPQQAKALVLQQSQYSLVDGVLYRVIGDGTLRIIPPTADRQSLFHTIHAGKFGGHLREAKIFSTLSTHYWWPGMRGDIATWCRSCLTCATRRVGESIKPYLMPIPVGGPFDRIGVDILQLPKSSRGNMYAVVFMDYLTKWPEVYPTRDQTAPTIARLLVEKIVCRHGVPGELLSDRGATFLSGLMQEVYSLLGVHKATTTAYHPQTDGLVERFNRTLLEMLSKTCEASSNGKDWDVRLPYVLYSYRVSVHPSTGESPFYLLYGRDARLPTPEVLTPPVQRYPVDATDYRTEMTTRMSEAWESARVHVKKAQNRQKKQYDRHAAPCNVVAGDRVFVYMPAAKSGRAWKLARPFYGPYRVVRALEGGVEVVPIDKPQENPIRVSLQRIRRCPAELGDKFYPRKDQDSTSATDSKRQENDQSHTIDENGWSSRLRSGGRGRPSSQAGEI